VQTLVPAEAPLILRIDSTLERRQGRHIAYKGRFHDAARAQIGHVVTSEGVHWLGGMLVVRLPCAWPRAPPSGETGTALWHRDGEDPLPLRWMLVRHPKPREPVALFRTDPAVSAEHSLAWYRGRWSIEVTFPEARAHLGLETQRHSNTPAIGRTTPSLFGLFRLVVLRAHPLHPHDLPPRQAAGYAKGEPTFSDVLAVVRPHLWASRNRPTPTTPPASAHSPDHLLTALIEAACDAAGNGQSRGSSTMD
jgi:hypothetical protein